MASKVRKIRCAAAEMMQSQQHNFSSTFPIVTERHTLLSTLGNFSYSLLENAINVLTQTLLSGNISLSESVTPRFLMLQLVLSYLSYLRRFDEQLFIKKVVSTDNNQASNMKNLITCSLSNRFDNSFDNLFLVRKFTFSILLIPGTL